MPKLTTQEKILALTGPVIEGGCRDWQGARTGDGYGAIRVGAKTLVVTRVILGLDSGDGRLALHSCDRPPCVERGHLSIGTHAENMAQSSARGRHDRGSRQHSAKLDEVQVAALRAVKRTGVFENSELAKWFGLNPKTVWDIVNGLTWRHVVS